MIDSTADASIENNLYAYCFNNPCNLDDVCGNWPDWLKKTVAAVAVVAVVAAVAVAVVATAGVGTAAAVVAVSAAKGAAVGMATGAVIGAGTGAISHRVRTGSWDGAGEAALNGMGDGALSGAISGTFTGAASGALKVYKASRMWNGVPKKGISPYEDMARHYKTHVLDEQQVQRARDIVNYTKDAVEFYSQHMDDLVPHNPNCWKIWGAPGGMYTDDGKILTFWYTKR